MPARNDKSSRNTREMTLKHVKSPPMLPARSPDSHKGTFGRLLLVGGSRRMCGAIALATNSALRGGAGLVEFAAPESVQLTVAGVCPCATSFPLTCKANGDLSAVATGEVVKRVTLADAVGVGPGFDQGVVQENIVQAVLEREKPAVIDADGLNSLARLQGWPKLRRCPLILTPHPGEFARLTEKSVKEVQADRENLAVEFARQWASAGKTDQPLVLVLKGHNTVVTDGTSVYINHTGNPGMATGGTGDILTGLSGSFLAQKLAPFEAACLAVHCHGRAGDLAAEKLGQASLIASDLWDYLPQAIQERTQKE